MNVKAKARKEEIISGWVEARRKILDVAVSLSQAQQNQVFLGVWSAKDLLAHLIGWDYTNLEAAKAILTDELPSFYAHHDQDWKSYNARLVAQHKRDDFAAMLAAAKESQQALLAYLETVPAEEFGRDRGIRFRGYKVTIASLLQAEAKDEETHYQQLRAFHSKGGETDE
jgi:hypothetical protein